jgi:nucleoside-diphosphate-sugar epimerase
MRVLILGGTGFSGPHVVRRLCALGHDVAVFHRGQHEPELPPEVVHIHDPAISVGERRFTHHREEFERFAPDLVLDTLAMNEADARAAVDSFHHLVSRMVVLSSQDVYRTYGRLHGTEPGPPVPVPVAEDGLLRERLYPHRTEPLRAADDPQRGLDFYDKIVVERLFMEQPEFKGTVLRLPAVYGPDDAQHRLFPALKRMDDGRPAIIIPESLAQWRWTRGYVENIAEAIVLAVMDERAAGQIYNAGEPDALTHVEWLQAIARASGWRGRVVAVPEDALPEKRRSQVDHAQDFVADTSRIRRELGYREVVPREEALRRTVAWERAHSPEVIDSEAFDYAVDDAILAQGIGVTVCQVG